MQELGILQFYLALFKARYTTILFSIIQSAKTNNLNVMKYLEFLINEVNNNKESLDKLMPYSKEMRDKFSNKI